VNIFLDKKLKLSDERRKNIENVTGFGVKNDTEAGVCQKCYRSVERVLKMEKETSELKGKIRNSAHTVQSTLLLSVPSPKRSAISKRMLRSPAFTQPAKKQINPNLPITYVQPVTVMPFTDIAML